MDTQVLIVGAGPVGLTMAAELTRYGVSIRIVDKAPQPTDKSKALVLWSRTLELLGRGPGAARFISAGFKAEGANIVAGDKQIGHVDLGGADTPFPFGLMLPQCDTERLLGAYLGELGVSVERGVEVTSFNRRADGVDAALQRADGGQESVSADWLIGCDGAHSLVRHSVGAPFSGETMDSDWILADVHIDGYPFPNTDISVHWHKDGAFVIFPISPASARRLLTSSTSSLSIPSIIFLRGSSSIRVRRSLGPPGATRRAGRGAAHPPRGPCRRRWGCGPPARP